MNEIESIGLIEESMRKLESEKMIDGVLYFSESLPLLGPGTQLDSLGFISFLTDLEERISLKTNKETYIVLNNIENFDISQSKLTVLQLAQHIVKLTKVN